MLLQVLHPHISTLLTGPEWDYWRGKLDSLSYPADAMAEVWRVDIAPLFY